MCFRHDDFHVRSYPTVSYQEVVHADGIHGLLFYLAKSKTSSQIWKERRLITRV